LEREKGREEEDMKLKGKGFHIGETGEHRLGTSGTDPENFSRANAGIARQHEHVNSDRPANIQELF
jgi:hypothetical protein